MIGSFDVPPTAARINTRQNWLSFHALMARLLCRGLTDQSSMAIQPFKAILETVDANPDKLLHHLRGINVWLDYAGEALIKSHAKETGPTGLLWRGPRGFSRARWRFWQQSLLRLTCDCNQQPDVRGMAQIAWARLTKLLEECGP